MHKTVDFYKKILENIPEGILVCKSDLQILYYNKAFQNYTGYSGKILSRKMLSELIKTDISTCLMCNAGNITSVNSEFSHAAELIDAENKLIPVRISHNISNEYIISIIVPLSEIAFLNQAHIDFVSTVSHELRTPLTSIKGFADTLLNAGDRLGKEQQKKFLSIIKNQVDRLTRLVENLLTVTKLESKKDKSIYKAVNIKELINITVQNIQSKAQDRKITVNILKNLPPIYADSDKMEQIMTNLIDNAIKYSYPNTEIIISANFAKDNPDFIEINVSNQGIGIPEEYLTSIFTKFSRIDNPLTRQVEGTGLGLYITKSLVDGMGGKISAKSNNNVTIFTVTMPVATPEKQASEKFKQEIN